MHLKTPRFTPLKDEEWNDEQRDLLAPLVSMNQAYNIFRTMARNPTALAAFLEWGRYILRDNSLSKRDRELVILRVGWLCRAGYEWAQHVLIGKRAGLTDPEIERIKAGADAPGWSASDQALLRATDDLHERQFISDPNWAALRAHFDETQCMDVVFTAGQYTQVSMILNSFGVQLDEGLKTDPALLPQA